MKQSKYQSVHEVLKGNKLSESKNTLKNDFGKINVIDKKCTFE